METQFDDLDQILTEAEEVIVHLGWDPDELTGDGEDFDSRLQELLIAAQEEGLPSGELKSELMHFARIVQRLSQ